VIWSLRGQRRGAGNVGARATSVRVTGKVLQHLQGFGLRHGRLYPGKKGWTKAYPHRLTTVRFEHPAQQIVPQDHIHAVTDAEARIERLIGQIAVLLPSWSLAPVVEAIQGHVWVHRLSWRWRW
jgi:hypothetical protein